MRAAEGPALQVGERVRVACWRYRRAVVERLPDARSRRVVVRCEDGARLVVAVLASELVRER